MGYFARSPLRYPGGKSRVVRRILPVILQKVGAQGICAPFLGGGSLELAAADSGQRVFGYDLFGPLINFWRCALDDGARLAELAARHFPMNKAQGWELRKSYPTGDSWEDAAAFFALNRVSFMGLTFSGGICQHQARFTPAVIERLRAFRCPGLTAQEADFREAIAWHPDAFLYLDPPYFLPGSNNLYGEWGGLQENFDHPALRDILGRRGDWVLCYNDHPEALCLYEGYRALVLGWPYASRLAKTENRRKDVLILAHDVPAFGWWWIGKGGRLEPGPDSHRTDIDWVSGGCPK